MQKATGGLASLRKSAVVSLLDWYDMDKEVLLVMERPVSSSDLYSYLLCNKGPLKEDQAKVLKLVGVCFLCLVFGVSSELLRLIVLGPNQSKSINFF